MARSKNPASVLDGAQSGADAEARALQAKKLATLKPKFQSISLDSVEIDRNFNVREEGSYAKEENSDLYSSLLEFGLDTTKPLIAVSDRKTSKGLSFSSDSTHQYLTLRGNLRVTMMKLINEEMIAKGQPAKFKNIDVLVYSDLTADDEICIMADHTGSKELNKFELAQMLGKTRAARGYTYKQLSAYCGIHQSTVQRLCNIYEMPPVLEELRKVVNGVEDAIEFGQGHVTKLYAAYQLDYKVDGVPRKCDGPNFRACWESVLDDINNRADKSPIRKAKSGTDISTAKDAIKAIPGEISELTGKILDWTLGEPVQLTSLIESLTTRMNVRIAKLEQENERLRGENLELKDEIRHLKGTPEPDTETLADVVG